MNCINRVRKKNYCGFQVPLGRIEVQGLMVGQWNFLRIFFYLLGEDLLRVVDDVWLTRNVARSMNVTFIALISKVDHLSSFDDFWLISLCNIMQKIVLKVIAVRMNPILTNCFSLKQFDFLQGQHIQEVIHSIKMNRILMEILNIDI